MGLISWLFGKRTDAGDLPDDYISKSLLFSYLDAQSATVMFFSPAKGWVGANLAFYNTFGFKNMEEFRAQYDRIADFFNDPNYEIFAETDEQWLRQLEREAEKPPQVHMKLPNGQTKVFALRSRVFKSGLNGLSFLEMTDVTEQERARQERERAETAKQQFLHNISHEFRTPMNGIMGFVELLKSSHPTSTQRDYIEMIERSSQYMMNNIESLLDLAQMQTGRLSLEVTEFKPMGELEALFKHYEYEARQRGIGLYVFIDPAMPTYIEADPRKFRQVISLLVDNAVKFTEAGGRVHVDIRVLKKHANDLYTLHVSVKDTGVGIQPERLASITKPFETGGHSDNRLGVGLTLTEGLLQMMGTWLDVTSEAGRGSHFSFNLEVTGTTVTSFDPIRDHSAKVLLFDDDRLFDGNLLSRYLQSFGLSVTKVHYTEHVDCGEADILYIVAPKENSGWLMQLGAFESHPCRFVMLIDEDEELPERVRQVVDYTLKKPLLPSRISKHLTQVLQLPVKAVEKPQGAERKVKALVVEDNIINQRLTKLLLEEYNLSVTTASNGSDAVELCRKFPFDVIFMDIDMPVKDGIAATQEIRKLPLFREHPAPIVALTALVMEGDRERILAEGLDDYLAKPLGREKLEGILERYLSKPALS
ncbi:response regulator [Sulfurimonas diazotrophicus]|uniref:histidine kinase n=1 Tax=Sulfurimonas diazotrophicus TaxID=3131939 RepID=A0ABZ3H7H7_9BACT